jgi:hypothetical protein
LSVVPLQLAGIAPASASTRQVCGRPRVSQAPPPNSQAGLSIISATYGHDQVLDRPFSAFPIDIPISSNLPAADGIQPSFSWLFQARMIDIYSFFIARTMRKSTDLAS